MDQEVVVSEQIALNSAYWGSRLLLNIPYDPAVAHYIVRLVAVRLPPKPPPTPKCWTKRKVTRGS